MSNSSLISYTQLSPNKTNGRTYGGKTYAIDTITIHCYVGQITCERAGAGFANTSRQASCNYVVDTNGKIGLIVEEKNRSWCTGGDIRNNGLTGSLNDYRAITIEVASDTTDPYAVNSKAYNALIDLCADICKRNGIKKLVWSDNKTDRINHRNGCNMTVHRDYATKACPGDYLYSHMTDIAAKVNAKLGTTSTTAQTTTTTTTTTNTTITKNYLSQGDKGSAVITLQKNLIALGYSCGTSGADGSFGPATLAAVKKFQKDHNITVDGLVGPTTQATITAALNSKTTTYKVKVTVSALNYRAGAGTKYKINGCITDRGTYTIIETATDSSGLQWGRLQSKAGWICLKYTKKI